MSLRIVPVTLAEANAFVAKLHRHSKPTVGHRFSVGVEELVVRERIPSGPHGAWELRGVAIAGRPVARALDDGRTVEILRVCTDGARNACSKLYAACCRAAEGMGYALAVTYTLASESGASLRASGFKPVGEVKDRQWDTPSRPREQRELLGDRIRWERTL